MATLLVSELVNGHNSTRFDSYPTEEKAVEALNQAQTYWEGKGAEIDRYHPQAFDATLSETHAVAITVL